MFEEEFLKELSNEGLDELVYNKYEIPETKKNEKKEPIGKDLKSPCFEDLVYPENVKEIIKLIIQNCKKRNLNILLYGGQGTGKSTTGKMLAYETNRPFVYLNGSMNKKKIIEILSNLKDNALVLVDEIHSWSTKESEIIYPAIQDNELVVDGKSIELNCMFVGTTTEPQEIPKPLRDRFQEIELEELDKDLLKEVLKKKGCPEQVSDYLLNFSTNMRILLNLLKMIELYGEYNMQNLKKVFRLKKINMHSGLSDLQEKYLEFLKKVKKAGVRIIGLQLRKSETYIKYEVEPDLIKKGFITTTSRGREINPEIADNVWDYLSGEKETNKSAFTQDEREMAMQFLEENPQIKKKFGSRYFELVNFIAEKIEEGIMPDEIDVYSFGEDQDIKSSYDNNYKNQLEEL